MSEKRKSNLATSKYSVLIGCSVSIVVSVVTLLAGEGLYIIAQKGKPTTSLMYKVYKKFLAHPEPVRNEQETKLTSQETEISQLLPNYLSDRQEIEALLDEFKSSGVLLGNTPYKELLNVEARLTYVDEETQTLKTKPNTTVMGSYLRSRIFYNWDPVVFQKRKNDSSITQQIKEFTSKYAFQEVIHSTNEKGERITIPQVESQEIILVVGDSNAFSVMVNDDETLASVLQQRYPKVKFINAGVTGGRITDTFQILREKLIDYGTKVKGVVYVHTENDWHGQQLYTPKKLVEELNNFLNEYKINYRVFVYTEYIYRTMPDIVRQDSLGGKHSLSLGDYIRFKNETFKFLNQHENFVVVNVNDVVQEERERSGSLFAGFSLYVDHVHFSRKGIELLADRIPSPQF